MSKLNLSQAAKAVGVHRNTLRRHIKEKGISVEYDDKNKPLIDTTELIRVYGELQTSGASSAVHHTAPDVQSSAGQKSTENALLHQQIAFLEQQLSEAKEQTRKAELREDEAKQRERELLDVVRSQTRLLAAPEEQGEERKSLWQRLTGS